MTSLETYMNKHFKLNIMYQDYRSGVNTVLKSDIVNIKEYKDFDKYLEDLASLFQTDAKMITFRHWVDKKLLTIEFIGHVLSFKKVTQGQVGHAKTLCITHIFERI